MIGPSGSGKSSIIEEVIPRTANLSPLVTVTTRRPRKDEEHGKDYFFVSWEEFNRMMQEGQLVEWNDHYENYYGCLRSMLEDALGQGKDLIGEYDVEGSVKLMEKYPHNVVTIFVPPPSKKEQQKRIRGRTGQTVEEQISRIQRLDQEMKYLSAFKYVVINDDLPEAINEVCAIIRAERNRHRALKERAKPRGYHLYHEIVTALVLDEEKVLLVKSQQGPESDLWCLPGGHIREGEYPHEAVLRHVAALTGYHVKILSPRTDVKTSPPVESIPQPWDVLLEDIESHYDYTYIYRCSIKERVTAGEAPEVKWSSIAEVSDLRVSPTARFALQRLRKVNSRSDVRLINAES
jgi:guanylate kinase